MAKKTNFDSIVIGGGLTGLIAAEVLTRTGRDVAIVEAHDALGASSRAFHSPYGEIDFELKFLPNLPHSLDVLKWLEFFLQAPMDISLLDSQPLTFENAKFKNFVGFGSQTPKTHDALVYYTAHQNWILHQSPKDWVKILSQDSKAHAFCKSVVTKFENEGENLKSIQINGDEWLHAREFIWCAPPIQLNRLVPEGLIPTKIKQKIAKGPHFASLHLDIVHSEVLAEANLIHILQGANEEPLAGRFSNLSFEGKNLQLSQWVMFIESIDADDEELIASLLKYMKRQISRAYEKAMDVKLYERIVLNNYSHGRIDLKLDSLQLPKLSNFWVCDQAFSESGDLLGSLEVAKNFAELFKVSLQINENSQVEDSAPDQITSEA